MTSVKKKMGRIGVVTLLLVLLTAFMGVMASAEEGGYWTEQLDEEGRVVRIFTYTEPVEFVISNTGNNDPHYRRHGRRRHGDAGRSGLRSV